MLTVIYLIVRTVALKGFSHSVAQISWLTVVLTWPSLLLFYLKLLVWPVGLSPFYGLQFVFHPTLQNTLFPALALLLVAAGLWKWASRSRPVALAIPWLIIPLLPVLNIQLFGNVLTGISSLPADTTSICSPPSASTTSAAVRFSTPCSLTFAKRPRLLQTI